MSCLVSFFLQLHFFTLAIMSWKNSKTIAHIDLDTFFVSVERLLNPDLIGKPVIVGGKSSRSVVSSCSYEARTFGVRSAMPMYKALQLCPQAIVSCSGMKWYSYYSQQVTSIIAERAPLFEKASVDEHYLDLTGMDPFFGCRKWMHELRETIIRETGLPISFGLSATRMVSKIASDMAKPNGELEVLPADTQPFLAAIPIEKMPGIGPKSKQHFYTLGIKTIGDLAFLSQENVIQHFGKTGIYLWKKANGIDNSHVIPHHEQKSMSSETTFETDVKDAAQLESVLFRMVERLAYSLRKQKKLTSCITIKFRFPNFETRTVQQQVSYTSFDHELFPQVQILFRKNYPRSQPIRLIGLRFSSLVPGNPMIDLFENTEKQSNLYQAVDLLRQRFGNKSVVRAGGVS